MKAVILDGGTADDGFGVSVRDTVEQALCGTGWEVRSFAMAAQRVAICRGCFSCWMRDPGACVQQDDGSAILRQVATCEALVLLSPVTFGGYAGRLKQVIDRLIPLAWPLFTRRDGEMRHPIRYQPFSLLAIGWQRTADPDAAAVFARLGERNAGNLATKRQRSLVLQASQRLPMQFDELGPCPRPALRFGVEAVLDQDVPHGRSRNPMAEPELSELAVDPG